VPEIARQLAAFVTPEAAPPPEPAAASPGANADLAAESAVPARAAGRPRRAAARPPQPNIAHYLGGLLALLVLVVVGWLFWPRSNGDGSGSAPRPGGTAPPAFTPAEGGAPPAGKGTTATGFAGWSDQEADLPAAELRRLRGVGAWSGDRLTVTVYNGSAWRVTEILVRTSRLRGDEFVDAETPHWLLPSGGAPVDAGVADLLNKVAPDRKKPGVNPLDTGPFQATVGPQPPAYRWRIEGARGYPPRL